MTAIEDRVAGPATVGPAAGSLAPAPRPLVVYGADWCGDTLRSKALLDRLGLPYLSVDVDLDEAASAWAAAQNGGERRIPVIVLDADRRPLIEPSDDALLAALRESGYLASDDRAGAVPVAPGRGAIAAR